MKIAVLTLPLHTNYGGNLQCYALCRVLQNAGHQVEVLHLKPSPKKNPTLIVLCKRFVKKLLGRTDGIVFLERKEVREYPMVRQHFYDFWKEHLPLSKVTYDGKMLKSFEDLAFDAVIVGSDQVWRPCYALKNLGIFYLDFLEKNRTIKKIAYAASFGTDALEYTEEERERAGHLIRLFDAISVREASAVSLMKEGYHWNCGEPEWVLDPTLLLNSSDYLALIGKKDLSENPVLFSYILNESTEKQVILRNISIKKKLEVYTIKCENPLTTAPVETRIVPPISLWLETFIRAQFVVTDSFHGCVFCIIFNKPFVVCANRNRGMARINSLLDFFGLQDRFLLDIYNEGDSVIDLPIDWIEVNRKRTARAKKSIDFLKNALR